MIILPDRNIPRARFLKPVADKEWRQPSLFVPKDQLGNDVVKTRFRVTARANDGAIVWRGWFDERHDADAFLHAIALGTIKQERALWDLPTPNWQPYLGELISYDFATVTFLTTTGSNQTYTSPSDWNNGNNSIECIGGAGGGGSAGFGHATGGGAGAYSKITNFSFATPGTTTATYRVGSGAAEKADGSATWFNASADPGNGTDNSKCSAAAGVKGVSGSGSQNGGAGGATASSWGQTKYAGGRGGNLTGSSGNGGSGGGGAAGPSGAGGNGGDSTSTSAITTNGGSANNGTTAGGTSGGNGSSGTEFDPSYGCGSGGAGKSADFAAGGGANYGGAGGGNAGTFSSAGGSGKQGLIVVTYTPATATADFNMPMLGM